MFELQDKMTDVWKCSPLKNFSKVSRLLPLKYKQNPCANEPKCSTTILFLALNCLNKKRELVYILKKDKEKVLELSIDIL